MPSTTTADRVHFLSANEGKCTQAAFLTRASRNRQALAPDAVLSCAIERLSGRARTVFA